MYGTLGHQNMTGPGLAGLDAKLELDLIWRAWIRISVCALEGRYLAFKVYVDKHRYWGWGLSGGNPETKISMHDAASSCLIRSAYESNIEVGFYMSRYWRPSAPWPFACLISFATFRHVCGRYAAAEGFSRDSQCVCTFGFIYVPVRPKLQSIVTISSPPHWEILYKTGLDVL